MAIKFLTTSNGLTRTTNITQGAAPSYSWFVWFRPDVDLISPNYQTVVALEGAVEYHGVYSDPSDSEKYKLELNNNAGSGDQSTAGTVLLAGHWYPIGMHRSGTFSQWLVLTQPTTTLNFNMAAAIFTNLLLGYDGSGQNKGTFAYFREWTAVLGPTDLYLEANSRVAVHTANLITDTPLTSDLLDLTINHNDWTATGVVNTDYQFVTDDPIPANNTASNPIIINSLPYTTPNNVKPTNVELLFIQWYKYTAVAPEDYQGGWFFGDLTNFAPEVRVYSDEGVTEWPPGDGIDLFGNLANRRFQMPVVAGNSYWYRIFPTWADFSGNTVLHPDIVTGPRKPIPPGSIFINDDFPNFFSAILSTVNGDDYNVLKFISFTDTNSEEGGDVLSNGNGNILVIDDDAGGTIKLFNSNLGHLVDTPLSGGPTSAIRRLQDGTAFYVGIVLTISRVDKDGNITQTWTLPSGNSVGSLAANNAQTILYVATNTGVVNNTPVKRWDLVNSVFLTDLAAGIANYYTESMLVLNDGSILVMYYRHITVRDMKVIRYDPTGTILNTYALGSPLGFGSGLGGSISYDFSDPNNYFLARVHNLVLDGGTSVLRIKLSDGSISYQVNHVRFNAGVYQPDLTDTPLAKFGPTQSCPFFPISFSEGGGIYKLVPNSSQYIPRRNDKLWLDVTAKTTEEVKIPDPFIESAAIGD